MKSANKIKKVTWIESSISPQNCLGYMLVSSLSWGVLHFTGNRATEELQKRVWNSSGVRYPKEIWIIFFP